MCIMVLENSLQLIAMVDVIWNPDKYFIWYMYGIYHTYTMYITYSGICMVYTTGASSAVVSAPALVPEVLGSNPASSPTHEACLRSLPVWLFE